MGWWHSSYKGMEYSAGFSTFVYILVELHVVGFIFASENVLTRIEGEICIC
jgi:hypothetical protein